MIINMKLPRLLGIITDDHAASMVESNAEQCYSSDRVREAVEEEASKHVIEVDTRLHPAPADHSINRRPCVWAAVGSAPPAAAASPRGVPPAPPRLHHPAAAAPPGRPPAPASPPAALPPPPCPAPAASLTREVALLLATLSRSATPIHSRASAGGHSLGQAHLELTVIGWVVNPKLQSFNKNI